MADRPETAVDDLAPWVAAYRRASDNLAMWRDVAERAKQKIVTALEKANAEVGTVGGQPAVRHITVVQRRVDTAQLRHDHPTLAAQYERDVTSRRFSLVTLPPATVDSVDTRETGAA